MKIGIFGIGGIGGFFGIQLALFAQRNSEHSVYFIARGENYNALKTSGLKLESENGNSQIDLLNVIDSQSEESYKDLDILLVCTKSYALEDAVEQFKDKISLNTVILPFLNGIDATDRIQKELPHHTILTGCVYVFARLISAGVVAQTGTFSAMHFGTDHPTAIHFYNVAKSAGINVHIYKEPRPIVWEKWSVISTTAGLNCFYEGANKKIVETEEHLQFFKKIHTEFCNVARACGVEMPLDSQEKLITKIQNSLSAKSSMYADYEKGNKTEVDSLIGHLLLLADKEKINIDGFTTIYHKITGKMRPK